MQSYVRVNPLEYPPLENESWWIVAPNNGNTEFVIPNRAVTACLKNFMDFRKGITYQVFKTNEQGWVDVLAVDTKTESTPIETIVCMPEYIFARYFDAEIFVRGRINFYKTKPNKEFESFIDDFTWQINSPNKDIKFSD